ncbi:hypothetical protein Tco_0534512 [Tanacetum coccineum]
MDDRNISMEEYIRLEEEKAQRHGRTFNWKTATYGKMECCEDEDDCFTNFETKFPAIAFDDTLTSDATPSCEPTISPLNKNKIDFRISFDESDDEDYMVIFDNNSFSYKIISVDNLKTDSENDNDKVNMPSFPSPEPTDNYFDDLDRFKDFENEISSHCATSEWFKKDCIGLVTTWEDLVEKVVQKFYQLSNKNEEMEAEERIKTYEEYELNNTVTRDLKEPWLDNGVPYQLCDHICEPYHFKNGMTKWPTCSSDIDGFCNGGELPGMTKVEESWGDATPGGMKFCAWLKSSFKNFHELGYNVLVKLEECGNYGAESAGYTQDNQEHKKEHHDPSTCRFRRFRMIKYSFDVEDEYVAIKEHECSEHSESNIDTCQAYRELIRIMDEGWLMKKACDE